MIILDDYSIECLSLVSSDFLGIHRNSFYFFGSQIYSWRESPSGQRIESSYGRAPVYVEIGAARHAHHVGTLSGNVASQDLVATS